MSPATSLISAGQSIQEMKTKMERIDDVMNYPEDKVFEAKCDTETTTKLDGDIELKNVTFGYSKLAKPLFNDLSISIKAGKKTAIVGRSGCGKSTLVKLISGLYQPDSGFISIDGNPLSDMDRKKLIGSVSVVDQESVLFDDTILENIRLWDQSIAGDCITDALKDAWIYDDVKAYDDYLQHRILDGGKDLSGGQRQRLEIARALVRNPSILILDEATSALDSETESNVMNSIKNRNITTIIVAHRLSTIKDCDEIIVIDKGAVVQRGTHDELFSKQGLYKELVSNE
jgi:ABC-type bacteriocin/lantibiotic exporter with double-glycine peptidase domain